MAGSQGTGKVALVVEDEAMIRMVLVDCLEDAGWVVLEAGTADAAVSMLARGEQVDVVVTDVRMPGSMDGIGLAAWIWNHRETTPVVVTSGYVTEAEAREANPSVLLVSKPYSVTGLISLLAGLLEQQGRGAGVS